MSLLWEKGTHCSSLPFEKVQSKTPTTTQNENKIRVGRNRRNRRRIFSTHGSIPVQIHFCRIDKTLQMELDTGAAFTIISERTCKTELPLLKCPIWLKTYTDERIAVLGQLNVHVSYGDQRAPLVLLIVAGDGPTLLGRNWLRYIRLDWEHIHAVSKSDTATALNNLLEKQSDLFKDELGKVSKIQASAPTLAHDFSSLDRYHLQSNL